MIVYSVYTHSAHNILCVAMYGCDYMYTYSIWGEGEGGGGIVRASHAILGPGEILWMNDLIGKAN